MNNANVCQGDCKRCIFKIQNNDSFQMIVFIHIDHRPFYRNTVLVKVNFYFIFTCFPSTGLGTKWALLFMAVVLGRDFKNIC